MSLINISDGGPIVTVTLNDPSRLNAMTDAMADEFAAAIDGLAGREDVRVVIITGAGRAFAAGGDLQMLQAKATKPAETNRQDMLRFYESFLSFQRLSVPVIAAVNGHGIGAGFCLALACDLRVIATQAKLGLNFVRLGLHPGMGGTFFLPRLVGPAAATELLLSGKTLSADQAHSLGLANSIVDSEEVVQHAVHLASSLRHSSPDAIRGLLETIRPDPTELKNALLREASEQARNFSSLDFQQGLNAALNKLSHAYWEA